MARTEIPARVEISDDLTGKPTDDAKPVKVTVDGKTGNLDMSADSLAAFVAFVTGPTDENRRAFGALIPRPKVASASRASGSNGDGKREWLRSNGFPTLAERGKFTDEMNAAWDAHNAAPAPAATEPASA